MNREKNLMAKAKETKVKNLRLRRRIRKTVGALFMASAVAVAAIPVQDIEAETLKADSVNDTRNNISYNSANHDISYDMQTALSGPGNKPTNTSYYVRDNGGTWSLNWQFKYYVVQVNNANAAIISDYNDTFQESEINIDSYTSNEYMKVNKTEFDNFYNTGTGSQKTSFAYDPDYLNYNSSGQKTKEMEWIEKYRKEEYDTFMEKCDYYLKYTKAEKAYNDAIDEWNKAGAIEENKPEKPAILNDPAPSQPTKLEYVPANDFSPAEKYKYYCDQTPAISVYGDFALVPAKDGTPEATEADIYLVKADTATSDTDKLGFLVTGTAPMPVLGVASNAFKGVTNVNTLNMPDTLKYVGDEAFVGSFIQNVELNNVQHIGNRAFKNCSDLKTVSLSYTSKIGAECFYGTGITQVSFPSLLSEIGYGAFANCSNLNEVNLNTITTECTIDDYAFYNDPAIQSIQMDTSGVIDLGEGVFALSSAPTGGLKNIALPNGITGEKNKSELGDLLFAGRTDLETVKFPSNYGTGISNKVNVPSGMFRSCASLREIDFSPAKGSNINGFVGFNATDTSADYNLLFLDVINPDFQVKGPETNLSGQTAFPRKSTWNAFTKVSNFVPYNYVDSNGVNCYEVSDGKYLLQANENGELTSCELIDRTTSAYPIDLIIPSKVGNYPITKISNGCFADDKLRDAIRSITIEDNSIQTIDAEVFKGLGNLESVEIGDSVKSIGDSAFADCPKLIDVTFHTPSVGYDGFTIGNNAFKTTSNELTFHGDIVPGYAPFDFATDKDNSKIDDAGKRICYKSLAPDFLTVMYDNKSGEVTLLDYPKYNELDERNADYCAAMEKYYTEKYGSSQTAYDGYRIDFTKQWAAAATPEDQENVYKGVYYGPWIDDDYVKDFSTWCTNSGVLSAKTPSAFYKLPENKYSIQKNYERGSSARGEFEAVTDEELQWINSCLNIVVPAGVTSIDATEFFDATENTRNVTTYFDSSDEGYKSYQMCTRSTDDSIPGLFSGYYKDYDSGSDEEKQYETENKGNDRILSVTMTDVKYLPDYAFDSCERLQSVTLGSACTDIGTAPFRGCDSLTDITGNDYFAAENRIVYSVNEDGTYTIEECLPSRGKTGSSPIVASSTDPIISNVSEIKDGAFEDCDDVVKVYLDDAKKLKVIPKNCFNDCDMLNEVGLPDSVNRIDTKAFGGNTGIEVTIPGKEVHIVSDAFEHVSTNTINTYKGTSADDYGQYYNINVEYLSDLYTVKFLDYDGTLLKEVKDVEAGKSAEPPADPTRTGYTFTGWMPKDGYNNVTSNVTLIAQYSDNSGSSNRHTVTFYAYDGKTVISTQYVDHEGAATAPMPPARSGYKFVAWIPDTFSKVTQDMSIVASYEKGDSENNGGGSGSGSKSSASPSPTASPGAGDSTKKYTVSVSGGSGSGSYAAGAVVAINAYFMGEGQTFDKWTTSTAGVGFANASASSTTFTMPAANVAITATYKAGKGTAATGSGGSGSNGGSSNSSNGTANTGNNSGTVVEITKPGVSNTGLAGATVTGATDNFVVKITEDQSATDAVTAALQAEYGDISRIQYFPMDISLYDSTGRTKIADTTGISVNITMPIPDELVQYAGNNKAGAVANGSLEGLGVKFTTVNGVPCINFTATHFSPYTIYVNTADLTASGTIDATPKTGDPIHPKWFLAIGMACISLVLFFKKDRVYIKKAG